MSNLEIVDQGKELQRLIHTLRGVEVMFDHDLAALYGVETRVFNQAVKRNIERFPDTFRFQLTAEEYDALRSQPVTLNNPVTNIQIPPSFGKSNRQQSLPGKENTASSGSEVIAPEKGRGKHRKYLPYAFTEQGVAMLSSVLRSETAIQTSISIINAFVEMRRYLAANVGLLQRLNLLEQRHSTLEIETATRFETVFDALEQKSVNPVQGIFFNGQIFDAYLFVNDLLRQATRSIILIDNYIDDSVLMQLTKRSGNVQATILCRNISKQLAQDLKKHNAQYPPITIREFADSHDRFLILDEEIVYHLGASLKDLGRKWFAFSKMAKSGLKVMDRIKAYLEH
ncbi:ORF6N domain-containing protein [Chlorobium sp. N1]|uniref:ORF6N domain-containing protein n=1 Tax=Chlorobium sp. N1 TaxID=2491138 RepID=UPI00103EDB42|nr:ORF6N domain-containing protein [Chlorobium sp. N1]